jgi:hypothetical protein
MGKDLARVCLKNNNLPFTEKVPKKVTEYLPA